MEISQIIKMSVPAIFASDSITAKDRVIIQAATIGANRLIKGNITDTIRANMFVTTGNATFQDRSRIVGDVTVSSRLVLLNGATHSGALNQGANIEFDTIPRLTFAVGSAPYTVPMGQTRTLSGGGSYKNLTVQDRATLILNAGTYYFESFTLNNDARLTLNGHVEIFVQNNITFGDRNTMSGATDNVFYSNGTAVTIPQMSFSGSITGPNAKIWLKDRCNLRGKIAGKIISMENDVKVNSN